MKIEATFARFKELTADDAQPKLSTRIKLLIKNMFDNRDSKWEKLIKENKAGPMKVDDLRRETERKLQQEYEERVKAEKDEQAYLHGSKGGRERRSGDSDRRYNQGP